MSFRYNINTSVHTMLLKLNQLQINVKIYAKVLFKTLIYNFISNKYV